MFIEVCKCTHKHIFFLYEAICLIIFTSNLYYLKTSSIFGKGKYFHMNLVITQ